MNYQIFIQKSALKALDRIPTKMRDRISKQILTLIDNPRPSDCKKLSGREAWRIRIGDYRVIYEIHDGKLIVLVIVIGHRKEVYR